MRINIIGGGLAGCALAYVFKQHGHEPVIYEASSELANGASGNDVGLYNPRFSAEHDFIGQFYSSAFDEAWGVFEEFGSKIDCNPCGSLHLISDWKKERRFKKMVQNWPWDAEVCRIIGSQEASDISGVYLSSDCLHLEKSGKISPKKLCHEYAKDVKVFLNSPINELSDLEGTCILACGTAAHRFQSASHLPLKPVRGQVSYIGQTDISKRLKCTLVFGGYIAPSEQGVHCLGSTFQPWLGHDNIISGDDEINIQKLCDEVPSLSGVYDVKDHRAGVRTTSKDHFPVVGQLEEGVYISTAHGSHGILSTLKAAHILYERIVHKGDEPFDGIEKALSPARFQ